MVAVVGLAVCRGSVEARCGVELGKVVCGFGVAAGKGCTWAVVVLFGFGGGVGVGEVEFGKGFGGWADDGRGALGHDVCGWYVEVGGGGVGQRGGSDGG